MTPNERKRAIEAATHIDWQGRKGRYSPELHCHLMAAWRRLQPDPVLGTTAATTEVIFGGHELTLGIGEVDELLELIERASLERERLRQGAVQPVTGAGAA